MRQHFQYKQVVLLQEPYPAERNGHLLAACRHGHAVGGDEVAVGVAAENPAMDDVAEFKGVVTKLLPRLLGLFAIQLQDILLQVGTHLHVVVHTFLVVFPLPGEG